MTKFLVTCERLVSVSVEVEADSPEAAIALYYETELVETLEAISDTTPPKATLLKDNDD